MKKRIAVICIASLSVLTLIAGLLGFFFLYYGQPKELFNEDGDYLEEAFAYNMSLNKKDGIKLFKRGSTDYAIRYSKDASAIEKLAAEDLQTALKEISGITFECTDDTVAPTGKEICIGNTNRGFSAPLNSDAAYAVVSKDKNIYIYGKAPCGVTNGVYGFCEDYLGVMYMTSDYTYYPKYDKAILPALNDRQEPAFISRDVACATVEESAYKRKLRYSFNEAYDDDGCHHSLCYIPLEEYYDEHPEYYALRNGVRVNGTGNVNGSQLCWSNPEVIELLKVKVLERIKSNEKNGLSQETYWDISQQDSIVECQCENCRALVDRYKSGIAPILCAVNEIARSYPQYKFSTLAYYYGSTPPVGLIPEKNVLIKYCIMSNFGTNDYSKPLIEATSDVGKKQYSELVGWSKLTDNIYVWDYITNYFNYQLPFPVLGVLQKNYRLFKASNVTGALSLSSYNHRGSGDSIKTYLTAHLVWDPDCAYDFLMKKYYSLYYGAAGKYVKAIAELQSAKMGGTLWVYDFASTHSKNYLSEENLNAYYELLNKGFEAVKGDGVLEKRLRYEEISLLYTKLANRYDLDNSQSDKEKFVRLCDEFELTYLDEFNTKKVDEYR